MTTTIEDAAALRGPGDRAYRAAGRSFEARDVAVISELARSGACATRNQLAIRTCETLDWRRATGAVKWRECRDLLERLDRDGVIALPPKRGGRPLGSRTSTPHTSAGEPGAPLTGRIGQFEPLAVEPVVSPHEHRLYRELVGRYHELGYRVPYGAHLRYLITVARPARAVVGAFQVSSAAWRLAARDRWIGWDDATRAQRLQLVVNNSRFLVLPWVRVADLASHALSRLVRRVADDWLARYAIRPLAIETLVDAARHRGTCYRAANWRELGMSAGRGRMDRLHERHGCAPKRVLVYPLTANAAARLASASA